MGGGGGGMKLTEVILVDSMKLELKGAILEDW